MELKVFRDVFGEDFTLGEFSVDGLHFAYTCEDTDRHLEDGRAAKVYGKTAIPRGRYKVVLSHSARFGKVMPEVLNVPGFRGIRIHAGNTAADTEGCLLLGVARDKNNGTVHRSREAVSLLMPLLELATEAGQEIWIEVA